MESNPSTYFFVALWPCPGDSGLCAWLAVWLAALCKTHSVGAAVGLSDAFVSPPLGGHLANAGTLSYQLDRGPLLLL